ncbi:MAG: carboxypeptidase-like regulatory domain-containing protein [Chitinophagales bacterium]
MRKRIENQITMLRTVATVCNINIALISANAGLNSIYLQFIAMLNALMPVAQAQILNRKGVAMNKKDAREKLALAVEEAQGIIMAHFNSVNDHDIFTAANVSLTKLRSMRDMKMLIHTQNIIDLLNEHQLVLTPFGVDAAYINNLQALFTIFDDIVSRPTVASNIRKAATADLEARIKLISVFLNNDLDKAMLVLKRTQPEFYKTYVNARNIIDNGVRHDDIVTGTLKGVIKEETTGIVIPNALVQIINTLAMVITNELGEFTITEIIPETYSIKISAGAYNIKTIDNVTITAGEETILDIHLAAIA